MPQLALPTLTAHLRSQSISVLQRDLNLEVFDRLLTPGALNAAAERLQKHPPEALSTAKTASALAQIPKYASQVESAKAVLRDGRFYDGPTSHAAFMILVQSLGLVSLPFYPAYLQFTSFRPPVAVDQSTQLLPIVDDPQRNLVYEPLREGILPDIVREVPDIVGISIITLDQMLAAMTLAHLVKEAGLPCHISVGGPHVSMLRDQIPRVPALFDLFDSAVVFSGESALLRLAEMLDGDGDLAQVPNLIYRSGGEVRMTPVEASSVNSSPDLTPDFDGLPLDRYLTPTPVLPLLSSHGCYHGKCAFCNVGYGGPEHFRLIDPDLVVEQMHTLHRRYGTRHIFFADEALTPRTLRTLAVRLADADPVLHWCGCVRFDPGLDRGLLEAVAEAGGRMLLFGLETAAESTIERMHKGTRREIMSRVLRDSAAAGIWNHTFFFFGFPGETLDDAQETVNFVYAHQDTIHSGSPGAFLLERYAPAQQSPQAYGITHIAEPAVQDLAIYFDYEVSIGLDEAAADNLASRLVEVLPKKRFGQYYITDVYRFLYASDLWEKGRPMPLWLA